MGPALHTGLAAPDEPNAPRPFGKEVVLEMKPGLAIADAEAIGRVVNGSVVGLRPGKSWVSARSWGPA